MVSVLYQDNHLLALEKPGGLLTQPSGTDLDSLEARAKAWVKETFQKPGAVFLEAVHRIDRVACGVVLFARTSKALSRLNAAIRAGECKKTYHALVEHRPQVEEGTLRNWLAHDDHCARICREGEKDAKLAELSYRLLEERDGLFLLEIALRTGRYHQIRAQLAAAGMPIAGDSLYGARRAYRPGAIALQHHCLEIVHPVTKEPLRITAREQL